jgi:programmed cell death protein 5
MDELEELKRKKLMEMQASQREAMQNQAQEQQELEEKISQLEGVVRQFLDKDALTRYGNLKVAHTEKAIRVLALFGQMIQKGQIKQQITDAQFKQILMRLEPPKKNFTIKKV